MNPPDTIANDACEQIKNTLLEHGREAVEQDAVLAKHLTACAQCRRLVQAWTDLPGLLNQLPEHEPDPKAVFAISEAVSPIGGTRGSRRRRYLAPSLASAAVLLAAIGLSRELLMHEAPRPPLPAPVELNQPQSSGALGRTNEAGAQEKKKAGAERARTSELDALRGAYHSQPGEERQSQDELAPLSRMDSSLESFEPPSGPLAGADNNLRKQTAGASSEPELHKPRQMAAREPVVQNLPSLKKDSADRDGLSFADNRSESESVMAEEEAVVVSGSRVVSETGQAGTVELLEDAVFTPPIQRPFDFISFYEQTDSITTQAATGYWSNNYVPGDPEIRLLNARLAQWDRSWLPSPELEQAVMPVAQPFDSPTDNALALSLMADTRAIRPGADGSQPTRLRLQVGIQGIEHRRGLRPSMNLGVIIDLPDDASDEVRIAARALLDSLLEAKRAGDRFTLVMTGPPGRSLVLSAEDFRFGSLELARQRIAGEDTIPLTDEAGRAPADIPDVYTAAQLAAQLVRENDDPGQPLGSSSLWLISAHGFGSPKALLDLVHDQARDGITTSVFPLGSGLTGEQARQIALAGLGSRRYLESPMQARTLVEEELHAASRAVARAVRLSVRLAPGVELIDVIGSQRLDTAQAQRVRDIEHSMDQRLASNLGIQADRGEDEDGIQMVIPGIFSGDSVTVLLDIITDRPGAIAEVSLRYKDLVYLKNGSLNAQLDLLAAGGVTVPQNRGPFELAVLKNLLSWHFAQAVGQAADALGQKQAARAASILRAMHETIANARREVPEWRQDPDLLRDQQVLEHYLKALENPQAASQQSYLADSLRFAAWAKTHHTPEEWK